MRKKVGILTLIGKNYNNHAGAVLQAYALQKTIEKFGYSSEIIDFIPASSVNINTLGTQLKRSLTTRGLINTLIVGIGTITGLKRRTHHYHRFKTRYMRFTLESFNKIGQLREITSNYDIFVVGSDTVWSPQLGTDNLRVYLLEFAEDHNIKISYAASVWYPIPPSLCPLYKNLLKRFDFVSVREKTSLEYLKQCGVEGDIKIVVDPTLLLSKKDYENISRAPLTVPKRPYIFYYDVHFSKGLFSRVISLARKTGSMVVTETAIIPKVSKNDIYSFYSCGPLEFLDLIKNAELVITTSFHGTVFSVIFEKQFYSIKPDFAPPNKIADFLEMVGLQSRLITVGDLNKKVFKDEPIEWKAVKRNLKDVVKHSKLFLKRALRGV